MHIKKTISAIDITIMCMVLIIPTVLAMPAEQNTVPPGENGYVHLSKYATPMEEPNVFRMDLDVEGFMRYDPIFVVFVLDASPSMYHLALKDPPDSNGYYLSRWSGLRAGYEAAIDIFADPDKNPAYDRTYISVVTFSGDIRNTTIRTADASTGKKYTLNTNGTATFADDVVDESPVKYFPTDLYGTIPQSYPASNGGFVKASTFKDDLKNCIPNYPHLSAGLQLHLKTNQPTALMKFNDPIQSWMFDTLGTRSHLGFELAEKLLRQTYNPVAFPSLPNLETQAKRYVVFLGDGQNNSYRSSARTHELIARIKAPRFVMMPLLAGTTKIANTEIYQTIASDTGLNTEVWSIGLGFNELIRDDWSATHPTYLYTTDIINPSWDTDFLPWLGAYTSPWSNSYIEPHLIAAAAPIVAPTDYALLTPSNINAGNPAGDNALSYAALKPVLEFYKTRAKTKSGSVEPYITYEYFNSIDPSVPGAIGKGAVNVFSSFAQAMISTGDITVTDLIGDFFNIIQYQNKPLLEVRPQPDAGTISMSGNALTWKINKIPISGIPVTLTYYLNLNNPTDDPSLWYESNKEAYITYTRPGLVNLGEDTTAKFDVVKHFPAPIVRPAGTVHESVPVLHTPTPAKIVPLPPSDLYPYGTLQAPYTPSPPVPLEDESVDEGATEGIITSSTPESNPVTIVCTALFGAVAIIVFIRKRKSN